MNDYVSNHHVTSHHPLLIHRLRSPSSDFTCRDSGEFNRRLSRFSDNQVDLELDDGIGVTGSGPAVASTGELEAVELRDGGAAWGG